jgi:hypothetical protein
MPVPGSPKKENLPTLIENHYSTLGRGQKNLLGGEERSKRADDKTQKKNQYK